MTTDEKLKEILERDYYVPDVTELCIELEYSYRAGDNIVHRTIESRFDLDFVFGLLLDNNLFVKKLDVEDIESFGFRDITLPQSIGKHFVKEEFRVAFEDSVYIADGIDIVFRGVIKNKSELERLFKQLSVSL